MKFLHLPNATFVPLDTNAPPLQLHLQEWLHALATNFASQVLKLLRLSTALLVLMPLIPIPSVWMTAFHALMEATAFQGQILLPAQWATIAPSQQNLQLSILALPASTLISMEERYLESADHVVLVTIVPRVLHLPHLALLVLTIMLPTFKLSALLAQLADIALLALTSL